MIPDQVTILKTPRRSFKFKDWNLIGHAWHGMVTCDSMIPAGSTIIFVETVGARYRIAITSAIYATPIEFFSRARDREWSFTFPLAKRMTRQDCRPSMMRHFAI